MFGDSVWAPFRSECDWEVASWAKMEGPSSSAVVEALGLSYRTADELNAIIDKTLPGYPSFKSLAIKIGGEELQFHYQDILPSIQALYGNPEFACDLIFAPERHYLDSEKTHRVYSEMHTGDWLSPLRFHQLTCDSKGRRVLTTKAIIEVMMRITKASMNPSVYRE
ncbi:hypothetical protein BC827DRAFT_1129682 [Russula dissimulans]|nr:hypothetical protein BC827DRAFT_1129682 [Russula dissimulans]